MEKVTEPELPIITDEVSEGVLNDPEYKRYCDYYGFTDVESKKNTIGFCIWKGFGLTI